MSRHRRNHSRERALIAALLAGCAAREPAPAQTEPGVQQESALAPLYDDSGVPLHRPEAEARSETQRQDSMGTTSGSTRPRRVGTRDVRLHGARLDDAFRALAVAGRFQLVIPEPLAKPIDLELVRVEPFDALIALAEAHGLSVSYRRGVVIVGTPEKAQP